MADPFQPQPQPQPQPVLYSFRRCPYAMRTRMALLASGQPCELREVVLRDKPEAMVRASPKATVPVLIDTDGTVRDESLQIMLWTLQRNDPDAWLAPEHGSLADMMSLIERFDAEFKDHLDRYKYATRFEGVDPMAHRTQAASMLLEVDQQLQVHGFLFDRRPALADFALAPFIRQFANADIGWFESQPWPALIQWLNQMLSNDLFSRSMKKYPQWQPGTAGIAFN